MAKRLVVLAGMLAVLLAAAVPALAQESPPGTITVTGTVEVVGADPDGNPAYGITDEASGEEYALAVAPDSPFAGFVGERVSIDGVPRSAPGGTVLDVVAFAPAQGGGPSPGPSPERSATFDFRLLVEGTPPEGARFFGAVPAEGCISVPLTDPEGDGVFAGSLDVPRFPPGPVPPLGTPPVSLPVQIVQTDGGAGPCNPTRVIEDFGTVLANDDTFRARANFEENGGGGTTPPETTAPEGTTPEEPTTPEPGNGGGDSDDSDGPGTSGGSENSGSGSGGSGNDAESSGSPSSATSGIRGMLPNTGGGMTLTGLIAGALLVGGGLLVRRLAR